MFVCLYLGLFIPIFKFIFVTHVHYSSSATNCKNISSANGSPVEHSEEGSLVATVAKKRRDRTNGSGGGGSDGADDEATGAAFDINVGDGRYISLSDPNTIEHLDDNMKNAAMNQLKILQDQMASLMAQLDK